MVEVDVPSPGGVDSTMMSPREDGNLSPATRKLIENLADGAALPDEAPPAAAAATAQDASEQSGGGGAEGAESALHNVAAAAQLAGAGAGAPMHVLYPVGQILPVGHALQYLGGQQQMQMPALNTAQQMFMLYLQGQHASQMQQAALSAQKQSMQQQSAAAQEGAGNAHAAPAAEQAEAKPFMLDQPQQKLQEQHKALQAQLQQHQVRKAQ